MMDKTNAGVFMKQIVPFALLCLTLSACESMEGTLELSESLQVKAKKTGLFQSGTRDVEIPAARYEAKLNPTSKTNIDLELKVEDKTRKIPFTIPKGTELPEVEGRLDILAETSGQPYDLAVNVKTETSSYSFDRQESCISRYVPERRCFTTPASRSCRTLPSRQECSSRGPRYEGPNPAQVCRTVPGRQDCVFRPAFTNCDIIQIPIYGTELVNYEKITNTKYIMVEILTAGKALGVFNHSKASSYDVAQGRGPCY